MLAAANKTGNSNMPNTLKNHPKILPEGPVVLTFWPLSRKLKKSSSATFATRAKRAVNQCLKINEPLH